jgi:hypothetical protein
MGKKQIAYKALVLTGLVAVLFGCGGTPGMTIYSSSLLSPTRGVMLQAGNLDMLQLCIGQIHVDGQNGGEGKHLEYVFRPGLIDVSDGEAKKWGTVEIPVGLTISKLKVRMSSDPELCGKDASVVFNGVESKEEIHLFYKFDPPIEVTALSSGVSLPLAGVVTSLLTSYQTGELTETNMKQKIEEVEEAAEQVNEPLE